MVTKNHFSVFSLFTRPRPPMWWWFCIFLLVNCIEHISTKPDNNSKQEASFLLDNVKVYDDIYKADRDNRDYRGLEFENGFKVLLIHDQKSETASVSMTVDVGTMEDPKDIQGLFHYLEHLLFLGTKSHPDPESWHKFIMKSGGFSNARTNAFETKFYYQVLNSMCKESLIWFMEFFQAPLFDEQKAPEELKAVHSEYEKFFDSDNLKLYMIDKETCDQSHNYSKLSVGNVETLKTIPEKNNIKVREELIRLHQQYYIASAMSLVIYANETINTLTKWAVNELHIKEMPKRKHIRKVYKDHFFQQEHLAKRIFIMPLNKEPQLVLTFPIQSWDLEFPRSRPAFFVSDLISNGGSLLHWLKTRHGLANNIQAREHMQTYGLSLFHIQITLTDKGLDNIEEILGKVFQYLNLIRIRLSTDGERLFDERKYILHNEFQQKEESEAIDYVTMLSSMLNDFKMKEVLLNYDSHDEYRPDLIEGVLDQLTPERLRYAIFSPKVQDQANLTEHYYGIRYGIESIPEDMLERLEQKMTTIDPYLTIVPPNLYIATNLELKPIEENQTYPQICSQNTYWRNWYQPRANQFQTAHAMYTFIFSSPVFTKSNHNAACLRLFVDLIMSQLNERLFGILKAGMSFQMQSDHIGFSCIASGYSEKLPMLLSAFERELLAFNEQRFDLIKWTRIQKLQNIQTQVLEEQTYVFLDELLLDINLSVEEELQELQEVTFDDITEVVTQALRKPFIEGFVHGNVVKNDVKALIQTEHLLTSSAETVPLPEEIAKQHSLVIEQGKRYLYRRHILSHTNNAILNYYQIGDYSLFNRTVTRLMTELMSDRFFNEIRTNQQLGYRVYQEPHITGTSSGMVTFIQGSSIPTNLDDKIEEFLRDSLKYLEMLPKEEFEHRKQNLLTKILQEPKNLLDKSQEYISQIYQKQYKFDYRIRYKELFASIEKDQLIKIFEDRIIEQPSKISIQLFGNQVKSLPPPSQAYQEIYSGEELKKDASFFPQFSFKPEDHLCENMISNFDDLSDEDVTLKPSYFDEIYD